MTYDSWKTTNPADQFLGPEPEPEEDETYDLDHYRDVLTVIAERLGRERFEWLASMVLEEIKTRGGLR